MKKRAGTAAAVLIAIPFICHLEGNSLKPYRDTANVWTVCNGEAYVSPNVNFSQAECDQKTKTQVGKYMDQVYALTGPLPPETLAAYTSFAYNIGIGAFSHSQTLTLAHAGKIAESCRAMLNWYTAGGKDCRQRLSGCYGLIGRRQQEVDLCLEGVNVP